MSNEKLVNVWVEWRRNPLRFVLDVIGAKPTNQQGLALREVGRMYESKMKSNLKQDLTDDERVRAKKIGISIRSGHGTGKDAFLSWVYLWLLTCFPGARGLVTAPTQHQLHDVLWSEMRKWCKRSVGNLHEYIDVQTEKAYRKDKSGKDDAFVVNRTAKVTGSADDQAEALSGMHGDYLILACDEASGVADGVFKPLEGAMTGMFNMAILIGNPTRNTGYFFNTHNLDRKNWVALHWSCEDSDMDLVMGNLAMSAYVERMADKYGKDSNFYRMRVAGDFPLAEPDSLIPLDLVLAAVNRPVVEDKRQGTVLGVDVAWMGDDISVICPRRGMTVDPLITFRNLDLMDLAGRIALCMADTQAKATLVDSIGVGGGVVSRLRELRRDVRPINVAESAPRKDKFVRLRDELWWRLRERFESRLISIPNDDDLIGELTSIKFKVESNGKIKVESKQDMRKRGLSSPNRADALMMTEYYEDSIFRENVADRYDMFREPDSRGGWMSG